MIYCGGPICLGQGYNMPRKRGSNAISQKISFVLYANRVVTNPKIMAMTLGVMAKTKENQSFPKRHYLTLMKREI